MRKWGGWLFLACLAGCSVRPAQLPSPTPRHIPSPTPSPKVTPAPPDPNAWIRKIERQSEYAPPQSEKDIKSLAAYLVKGCQNDREKALAIYVWVTSNLTYDHDVADDKVPRTDQSAAATLRRKDGVCEGFSLLYRDLARAAGLDAVDIAGHVKSWDTWVVGDDDYHAWNAVYWDRRWHLLDCTWDEGYLFEPFRPDGLPRYFDVPPEQMLASHFPDDPAWQLRLRPPMSAGYFVRQTRRSPMFFQLGLELMDNYEYYLRFDREYTIRLGVPAERVLYAQLRQNDKPVSSGGLLISRRGDQRVIEIRPPRPGKYSLFVWARHSYDLKSSLVLSFQLKSRQFAPSWPAYPETFPDYLSEQVLVQEPVKGVLKPGRQHFQLLAPGAETVVVNTGTQRVQLKKDGDCFEGECQLNRGFANVEAEYRHEDRFRPLLFYKVK